MTSDEQDVEAVVRRLFNAIDGLISGRGIGEMVDLWHHDDFITSGHPSGDWAHGWDEVLTVWQVLASLGAEGRGGIGIPEIKLRICGDMAYAASVATAPESLGGETLACTHVLERRDGAWKLVHHHADRSPKMVAAMEKFLLSG